MDSSLTTAWPPSISEMGKGQASQWPQLSGLEVCAVGGEGDVGLSSSSS